MMGSANRFGAVGRWLVGSRHGVAAIAQTIATRYLTAGLNFGTGIITARVLGPDGRGEQAAMMLWPMLVPYLLTLGIPTALRYCIRRDPERQAELFTMATLAAGVLSIVAIAVGVVFIPAWLHQYSLAVRSEAQICMIFGAEVMLNLITTAMLEAVGDFKGANSMRFFPTVLTFAVLLFMAVGHALTPFSSALAYLTPPVLAGVWGYWHLRRYLVFSAADPRPALRALGSYGIRAYGVDILGTLSAQVAQVLVVGFLSATAMGVYMVGLNTSRVLLLLHGAVVTVVFPNAAGVEPARVVPMVARAARVSTSLAAIFGLALGAALPLLIPAFYGRSFHDAVPVAQVLTVEAVIGGLGFVLTQAFLARGRPGFVTALQALGLPIAVPCMLVLMPRLGLMGAAVSLLIATCARLAFVLISFPLILRVPIPNLIPCADDFAIFRRLLAGNS
jgi:O-antigen/teichoic acid export membrane protein